MTFRTAVNSQITDAVTQNTVKVAGETPAQVKSDVPQAMTDESAGPSVEGAKSPQGGIRREHEPAGMS
ncbi:RebB family R body protein [Nitrospirillum iridis]|uniref:Uncharacterized protein n=1 Tax=Nitrospirillum iridis TaxID=765888 RepID=A0A7X0EDZ7_9PROT|nr:RebB family R body protein [Nitrospirillum iridis]MBB6251506.1 hypothetical protein [Nitrospirillum iridis]